MRYTALAMLLLAGCQAARMPLPEDFPPTERWTVEGRQGFKIREHLRFGPYEAASIKRSWTRGRDRGASVLERSERNQHFSFVLRESKVDDWYVKCEAALAASKVRVLGVEVNVDDRSRLNCALTSAGENEETWLLELSEQDENPLEGRLKNGSEEIVVRGTRKLEKALPAAVTSGYYVVEGGRTIGAVEVINRGAVILDNGLPTARRSLLSAAAGALLLVEDLREQLDNSNS